MSLSDFANKVESYEKDKGAIRDIHLEKELNVRFKEYKKWVDSVYRICAKEEVAYLHNDRLSL